MFEEAQLYSPVTQTEAGDVIVHLGADHPGFKDAEYRERRNAIAASAIAWEPGTPPLPIDYSDSENEVWRLVSAELAVKHERYAVREYRDAKALVALPEDRVPQLADVSAQLLPLSGFAYEPAPGLVDLRTFYGSLGRGAFLSTQYVRHPSQPLYTPEPDIIHEVIGHANMLGSPRFAALKRAAGEATMRVESDAALAMIADVFWFTLEFGVMYEEGELRAYGAGILSSYGEIEEFRSMEIRPLDIKAMATAEYDITSYQPVLFGAASFGELEDVVGGFFATVDDDTPARMGIAAVAS
jgi:phenylalanine-4-hydroxylase